MVKKSNTFSFILLGSLVLFWQSMYGQSDSVYLWPHSIPGETKPKSQPVITTIDDGTTRVTEMTNPFFAVFEPKKEIKNGKAVVICPGGHLFVWRSRKLPPHTKRFGLSLSTGKRFI